jgi:hypothetical protein
VRAGVGTVIGRVLLEVTDLVFEAVDLVVLAEEREEHGGVTALTCLGDRCDEGTHDHGDGRDQDAEELVIHEAPI